MKPFWVYILRCVDESYYTGHTDNLEKRVDEHQTGICDSYTSSRRPVELAWSQECATRAEALAAEIQIKGWSRKKKEAMMRGDWQAVNKLGRGKHQHQRSQCLALTVPPALHASTSDAARPTLSTNDVAMQPSNHPSHPFALSVGSFTAGVEGSKPESTDNNHHGKVQNTFFLGLDFGTSGARACVIDDATAIVWQHRFTYPAPDGQTPSDWRSALHSLLNALPEDIAAGLQGIALDGTSGTVLLSDAGLHPCSPAPLYHDNRAQLQAEQLKAIAPHGHTVCTATSGLAKFLWLTEQDDVHDAAYFLHQADWLTALLSGQPGSSDYHNALKTGYDIERLCWPDWVLALPHSHLLPRVLAPGEVIGLIQPDIAAHFGIHPRCFIHAGTTDSTAAFIAADVSETGVGVTTLGTTLVLKQLSTQCIEAAEYGVYSHRYGDLWLVGGASNAGAGVLRHYFDNGQLAALSAQIDPRCDSPLDYYPLTGIGERFPVNDVYLAPQLEPRPDHDVEFLHGLLQGLARIETTGYARLAGLGAPPLKRVVTNGGGAGNETWRILRERLLGVPVGTASHGEAAYGSALLCLDVLKS
jgi:sugar (pentulose or hexulose) kinase/predicted GIY-YIG superfamily endonuclease